MTSYHYTQEDLENAFISVGLKEGDIVFSHSNIGFFGRPQGGQSVQYVFDLILAALFEVIGKEGTLVVPTFTYSFSKGEIFDLYNTVSECGTFS